VAIDMPVELVIEGPIEKAVGRLVNCEIYAVWMQLEKPVDVMRPRKHRLPWITYVQDHAVNVPPAQCEIYWARIEMFLPHNVASTKPLKGVWYNEIRWKKAMSQWL